MTEFNKITLNQNEVIAEIEADPDLQQMLLNSDEDIKACRVYSTEEAIQYIRELHSNKN